MVSSPHGVCGCDLVEMRMRCGSIMAERWIAGNTTSGRNENEAVAYQCDEYQRTEHLTLNLRALSSESLVTSGLDALWDCLKCLFAFINHLQPLARNNAWTWWVTML